MKFQRDNLKSKTKYYLVLILLEIFGFTYLFFTEIRWIFLVLIFPFLIIEITSNARCLNRQNNFIKEIEFKENKLVCIHANNKKTIIEYTKLIYSFREIKFEKDKSELEIKIKGRIKNKLVGRIHINNWKNILEMY